MHMCRGLPGLLAGLLLAVAPVYAEDLAEEQGDAAPPSTEPSDAESTEAEPSDSEPSDAESTEAESSDADTFDPADAAPPPLQQAADDASAGSGAVAEPEPLAEAAAPGPVAPSLSWKLQARERARFLMRSAEDGAWAIENLATAGVSASMGPAFAHFEIRDQRNWGSDGTDGSLAVQQAYGGFELSNGLMLRVGRMEASWNSNRLMSHRPWSSAGNPFWGIDVVFSQQQVEAELIYIKRTLNDADHMFAIRAGPRLDSFLNLDVMAFVEANAESERSQATVGANAAGSKGLFSYQVEAYGQVVRIGDADPVSRWLVGARAGVQPEHRLKPYIGGGIDIMAKDFDNLFGAGRAFFGHYQVPGITDEGLIDGLFIFRARPYSALLFDLGVHVFASPWAEEEAFKGVEFNIEATWSPWDPFDLLIGAWIYVPGDEDPNPLVAGVVQAEFTF